MDCKSSDCKSFKTTEISHFENVEVEFNDVIVSENILLDLVYIGGYICKIIMQNCTCRSWQDVLLLNNDNVTSGVLKPEENYYFNVIDRGALKYPSEFIVNILITQFKLFSMLISDKFESIFLQCDSQKDILILLVNNVLENENVVFETCSDCGSSFKHFVDKCICIFCNILLNNYRKVIEGKLMAKKKKSSSKDTHKSPKKRKIDKLKP